MASISIEYKEQVVFISIKSSMQYLICLVSYNKCKNLWKIWPKKYMNTCCYNFRFKIPKIRLKKQS